MAAPLRSGKKNPSWPDLQLLLLWLRVALQKLRLHYTPLLSERFLRMSGNRDQTGRASFCLDWINEHYETLIG